MLKKIFANEHFVVVDKPHGALSVPSRMGSADPRPCVGKILEQETGAKILPVHRLDFEVGGLLMFARSAEAHRHASRWFEHHLVQKTYEALVALPENSSGECEGLITAAQKGWLTWEAQLVRGKKRAFAAPHGKHAVTRAHCLGRASLIGNAWAFFQNANLDLKHLLMWRLEPVTGRAHQLRWEMQRHDLPIVGDVLYGGMPLNIPDAIALRAVQIRFAGDADVEKFGLPRHGFEYF